MMTVSPDGLGEPGASWALRWLAQLLRGLGVEKHQAVTRSQFRGSRAFASALIVERRRVLTSCCQSTSLP